MVTKGMVTKGYWPVDASRKLRVRFDLRVEQIKDDHIEPPVLQPEAGPIPALAPCGPHVHAARMLLVVRGNRHTRGNIWKFSAEGFQSCGPCGAAGHPGPEP